MCDKRFGLFANLFGHASIDDPSLGIDESSIVVMRGTGPVGYPGAAEVVNMRAPDYLLRKGVQALPCLDDGHQSGTSGSPSILNASPEAAVSGGMASLKTGDVIRIDLQSGEVNVLVQDAELETQRKELESKGGPPIPASQTPWQEILRGLVGQLDIGAILEGAEQYQRIAQARGLPRNNH